MSKSIINLLPKNNAHIDKDLEIIYQGVDISKISSKSMNKIRGEEIAMVFQDPMTYLNPTMKVGNQIAESILEHEKISRLAAIEKALEILNLVKIKDAAKRLYQYPHELSGGMRQRVVLAIALALNPKMLIADEPTTALDVTIQADIMDLIEEIQEIHNTAILFITHDLSLAAEIADRIQVMYAGEVVETGSAKDIFENPMHPYTYALMQSVPSNDSKNNRLYSLQGTPPDLLKPPKACAFYKRCKYRMKICDMIHPKLVESKSGHYARCHLLNDMAPKVKFEK